MSTWTHSPACCLLGSFFDLISGVTCSALFIWISNAMMFNLAFIFPFLSWNNKNECFGEVLDCIRWSFSVFVWAYGKTHLHLQLILWDCLTHGRHYKWKRPSRQLVFKHISRPCPALTSSQNSQERRTLTWDPGHGNFQSWVSPSSLMQGLPKLCKVRWGWDWGREWGGTAVSLFSLVEGKRWVGSVLLGGVLLRE